MNRSRINPSHAHSPRVLAPSPRSNRTGFTLIEMVVVIGIIVMLVGLTVGVVTALSSKSETRATEMILEHLDKALAEWETIADKRLSYGANGQPAGAIYDIQEDPPDTPTVGANNDFNLTRRVLSFISRNPQSKALLANITGDRLKSEPNNTDIGLRLKILDAWDREILVVFPGRKAVVGDPIVDVDGTIRTEFENILGICVNKRIAFVSAGPDGRFGDLDIEVPNPTPSGAEADNIYSYELLKQEPQP